MTSAASDDRPHRVAVIVAVSSHSLDKIAGLPLLLRTILDLQRAKAQHAVVVVAPDQADATRQVLGDARVRIPIDWVDASTAEAGVGAQIQGFTGPLVITFAELVADPAVYLALFEAAAQGRTGIPFAKTGRYLGPVLTTTARSVDLVRLALRQGRENVGALIDEPSWQGQLERLPIDARYAVWAYDDVGKKQATKALFDACRKPVDGLISRHINRRISIAISKRLVDLPITPNAVTMVTLMVGALGAFCAARGGYVPTLVGAVLFQCNSVLDGVDGELARVRHEQSKSGEWLDTVFDDVANVLFYAGLVAGAQGEVLVMSGKVAVVATLIAMVINYSELWKLGSGDFYAIDWGFEKQPPARFWSRVVEAFRWVLKRDFFAFLFLCLAVIGVLPYVLPVAAMGAMIAALAAGWRRVRKKSGGRLGG